jgi:hypothetical protein
MTWVKESTYEDKVVMIAGRGDLKFKEKSEPKWDV